MLDKNLNNIIEDELFEIKNTELRKKIQLLKESLYSLENISKKNMNKDSIEKYLLKIKENSTEKLNRILIETFVKNIKIFQDRIEVTFRKFPKEFETISVKDGGSDGN